jgi:hypothetical protein
MYIIHDYRALYNFTTFFCDLHVKWKSEIIKTDQIKCCALFECQWNRVTTLMVGEPTRSHPTVGKALDENRGLATLNCHPLFGPLSSVNLSLVADSEHTNRHKAKIHNTEYMLTKLNVYIK